MGDFICLPHVPSHWFDSENDKILKFHRDISFLDFSNNFGWKWVNNRVIKQKISKQRWPDRSNLLFTGRQFRHIFQYIPSIIYREGVTILNFKLLFFSTYQKPSTALVMSICINFEVSPNISFRSLFFNFYLKRTASEYIGDDNPHNGPIAVLAYEKIRKIMTGIGSNLVLKKTLKFIIENR